ncbi:MAG: DNRLRE domain-containing protein [Limisphaerales bacterium]
MAFGTRVFRPLVWATSMACGLLAASRGEGADVRVPVSADTTLFATNPGNSLGRSDSLAVGATGKGFPARALIRFDLAGWVPEGTAVVGARLEFGIVKAPAGEEASMILAHRMLKDWSEGLGTGSLGSPARSGECTWTHQGHPDRPWEGPGCVPGHEYDAEVSGSVGMNAVGRYALEGEGLLADVRRWLADPSSNHGWILLGDREESKYTARRIGSKESANAGDAPVLVLILGSPGPRITRYGWVDAGFEIGFRAEAGNIYEVQYNTVGPGLDAWLTLTNVVAKLTSVDALVTDPVLGGDGRYRFYRVADVGDVD